MCISLLMLCLLFDLTKLTHSVILGRLGRAWPGLSPIHSATVMLLPSCIHGFLLSAIPYTESSAIVCFQLNLTYKLNKANFPLSHNLTRALTGTHTPGKEENFLWPPPKGRVCVAYSQRCLFCFDFQQFAIIFEHWRH